MLQFYNWNFVILCIKSLQLKNQSKLGARWRVTIVLLYILHGLIPSHFRKLNHVGFRALPTFSSRGNKKRRIWHEEIYSYWKVHLESLAMGAYLSQPITKKENSVEEDDNFWVASTSMQGWRVSQEVSNFWYLGNIVLTICTYNDYCLKWLISIDFILLLHSL